MPYLPPPAPGSTYRRAGGRETGTDIVDWFGVLILQFEISAWRDDAARLQRAGHSAPAEDTSFMAMCTFFSLFSHPGPGMSRSALARKSANAADLLTLMRTLAAGVTAGVGRACRAPGRAAAGARPLLKVRRVVRRRGGRTACGELIQLDARVLCRGTGPRHADRHVRSRPRTLQLRQGRLAGSGGDRPGYRDARCRPAAVVPHSDGSIRLSASRLMACPGWSRRGTSLRRT